LTFLEEFNKDPSVMEGEEKEKGSENKNEVFLQNGKKGSTLSVYIPQHLGY